MNKPDEVKAMLKLACTAMDNLDMVCREYDGELADEGYMRGYDNRRNALSDLEDTMEDFADIVSVLEMEL